MMTKSDPVNPSHYRNSAGVQLIEVIRWLPFSLGNALKYSYRNANKENAKQDLEKALWYLTDFLQAPTVVPDAATHITPQVVKAVFEGVDPFERDSCLFLLKLHECLLQGEDISALGREAQALFQEKITSLSPAEDSVALPLF